MKYLAVLDWNGTSMDDQDHAFSGVVAIFKHCGVKPPPSPQAFFCEIKADCLECYQKFGIPQTVTTEDLNRIWKAHFDIHRNGGRLRPGVKELLTYLREKKVTAAVVSGENDTILQRRLDEFNLRHLIDMAWGDCLEKGEALRRIASKLGLSPNAIIYVDDNFHGLVQAKAAGVITIGFTGGWQSPAKIGEANPNHRAHTIYDVKRIIEKLIEHGGTN